MKRMRKFGPKYGFKKFEEGGPTSYAESGSAGGTNISFKEAFRAARKQGLETFTWRGKKYTTELASDKSKKSEEKREEAPVNFATQGRKPTVDFAKEGRVKPKPQEVGEPTQAMRDEARSDVLKERNQKAPARPGGPGVRKKRIFNDLRFKGGGSVKSSASRRADGIAQRGKTRGKYV